jgi:hypothetical protein
MKSQTVNGILVSILNAQTCLCFDIPQSPRLVKTEHNHKTNS